MLQPTKVFERVRTIRQEGQLRGWIAGDEELPPTDQVVHPVRFDAERRGELGDGQPPRHMAWTWAPVAVEAPVLEPNGWDHTGQHGRALGRLQPLRGEDLGQLFRRFSWGCERADLRLQLREPGQVTQGSHGTGAFQRTNSPTTPYKACPDGIMRHAMQDHACIRPAEPVGMAPHTVDAALAH